MQLFFSFYPSTSAHLPDSMFVLNRMAENLKAKMENLKSSHAEIFC
jgi:hypothetical protein